MNNTPATSQDLAQIAHVVTERAATLHTIAVRTAIVQDLMWNWESAIANGVFTVAEIAGDLREIAAIFTDYADRIDNGTLLDLLCSFRDCPVHPAGECPSAATLT